MKVLIGKTWKRVEDLTRLEQLYSDLEAELEKAKSRLLEARYDVARITRGRAALLEAIRKTR